MKTVKDFIEELIVASDNNDMMELISIHDELLSVDVSILTKTVKYIKATNEVVYSVFSSASLMSRVEKNGVFNRITKQAFLRELLTENA
jgi:hypothetical protein